eukprot:c12267_g2_i2.p1 GENE.c12267_g2_i2~~c12267_g2_i2.p1  ORF type:complete len:811 (+),score=197.16 c12267_g2_i2:40-2472(+)
MAAFPELSAFRKNVSEMTSAVYGWGIGSAQLTSNSVGVTNCPKRISCLDSLDIVQVAVSQDRCIALTISSEVISANLFDPTEPIVHIGFTTPTPSLKEKMSKRKIVKVACCSGSEAFFALANNGELLSWGTEMALIGREVGPNNPPSKPYPVKSSYSFSDISVGSTHCIAMSTEGLVFSWGIGRSGRLGQGSCEDDERYPTLVQALKSYQIIQISAGWGHSAVLSSDGRSFVWGKNDCGQLGLGQDSGNVDTPRVVRELTSVRLIAVASGAFHTAFLTELGQVYVSGEQLNQRSYTPKHVPLNLWCVNITCGPFLTVATCQGAMGKQFYLWGKNTSGELGVGNVEDQSTPVAMSALSSMTVLDLKFAMNSGFCVVLAPEQARQHTAEVEKVVLASSVVINRNALSRRKKVHSPSAFSHDTHTESVMLNGSDVHVWGSVPKYFDPQAVVETENNVWYGVKPSILKELADKKITGVSTCDVGGMFLTGEGTVHHTRFASLEANSGGSELISVPTSGIEASIFKPKTFQRQRVREVACNNSVCFAVCENGFLFSWHWKDTHPRPILLGREATEENMYVPNPVHSVSNAVTVVCGELHVMVLREDMQLMAWGMSRCGQLGLGDTETQRTPQKISALQPYRLVEVAAGAEHSIVVTLDGNVWVWGKSADGQLGLGNEDSVLVPTRVPELTHIVACAAGVKHSVFLNNRGVVFVCGEGIPGQRLMTPTQVKMPFWTVAVWAGPYHTFAVCENPDGLGRDHSTYAWGTATGGALGLADIETCNTPQLVKFLEGKHIMASAFGCSGLGIGVIVRAKKE